MATACPILLDPKPNVWPRIYRWTMSNRDRRAKGAVRNKSDVCHQQIEMRSIQSIVWQPYQDSDVFQHPVIQTAANLSRYRVLLVDPQLGGHWYLGDRCYHQLFGEIAIPNDPPLPLFRLSREIVDDHIEQGWPLSQDYVKIASASEYKRYWRSVSTGPLLPPLSRGVNTDLVGYSQLMGGDVELPYPAHQLQGSTYNTQDTSSSSSIGTFVPMNYQRRLLDGELVTVPVSIDHIPDPEYLVNMDYSKEQWKQLAINTTKYSAVLRNAILDDTTELVEAMNEIEFALFEEANVNKDN